MKLLYVYIFKFQCCLRAFCFPLRNSLHFYHYFSLCVTLFTFTITFDNCSPINYKFPQNYSNINKSSLTWQLISHLFLTLPKLFLSFICLNCMLYSKELAIHHFGRDFTHTKILCRDCKSYFFLTTLVNFISISNNLFVTKDKLTLFIASE